MAAEVANCRRWHTLVRVGSAARKWSSADSGFWGIMPTYRCRFVRNAEYQAPDKRK
jgi:hypothetical protein